MTGADAVQLVMSVVLSETEAAEARSYMDGLHTPLAGSQIRDSSTVVLPEVRPAPWQLISHTCRWTLPREMTRSRPRVAAAAPAIHVSPGVQGLLRNQVLRFQAVAEDSDCVVPIRISILRHLQVK